MVAATAKGAMRCHERFSRLVTLNGLTQVFNEWTYRGQPAEQLQDGYQCGYTNSGSENTAETGKYAAHEGAPYLPAGAMKYVDVIQDESIFYCFAEAFVINAGLLCTIGPPIDH